MEQEQYLSYTPWQLTRKDGLDVLKYAFGPENQVSFCISTRRGGTSFDSGGLNLSHGTGDIAENVEENRSRLYGVLNNAGNVAGLRQIHSADVFHVTDKNRHTFINREIKGDGMITTLAESWLAISIGDCLAVGLYDAANNVLAMVHSGWRGTVQGISAAAITKMGDLYGTTPEDIWAVIGPGIGFSTYQVDIPVYSEFMAAGFDVDLIILDWDGSHGFLDNGGAVLQTLLESGIKQERIQDFGLCTYTLNALFFSHRRDGLPGGRMTAMAKISSR